MNPPETQALRDRACTGLTGHVLEIGFGSGLNLPHYPPSVTGLTAVEPSSVARRLAERRIRSTAIRMLFDGEDAA